MSAPALRVVLPRAEPTAAPATRALTTRALDFWLLGGASLAVWLPMYLFEGYRQSSWAVGVHFGNLAAVSATLALVCNYPHFMASYKLAYSRGARFVARYWVQLVLVPILLLAALALGWVLYQRPAGPLAASLGGGMRGLGLDTRIGTAPGAGAEVMGLLVNVMFFTVGWHYSKQTFGCMMVYAAFDGYPITPPQRRLLKASLHAVWATSYTYANLESTRRDFRGIPYFSLGLPGVCYLVAAAALVLGIVGVAVLVVLRTHRRTGLWPSANLLVPYVAFVIWWFPPLVQWQFYFLLVPFFHSLQYLPFFYKVERERLTEQHPGTMPLRAAATVLGVAAAGFLAFDLLPNMADVATGAHALLDAWFFAAAAHVFINVHHYFIDNTLWRFTSPDVRRYLLA
jgi:hypothetical protein